MWNPLDEPTCIPELAAIHEQLRKRHKIPSLELYAEYWNNLMRQSFHHSIERSSIGGKKFVKRMRSWRLHSIFLRGLEQKIQNELRVLHIVYNETIVPFQKVDDLLYSVEQFMKNVPTYKRLIPTALGYPKYKKLYGCCGLGIPSIPAIGFQDCLCKTHDNLSKTTYTYMNDIDNKNLLVHLRTIQGLLRMWKQNEIKARLANS